MEGRGDRAKQRECLDKALATESYDIEVLIECYQIPDSPADYRTKIRRLIEKRLCELREQVADLGANPCRGPDLQRVCLAGSQHRGRSRRGPAALATLARSGRRAGRFCDTLARVYFAKGDYAEAVKHQTRAAELLPYTHAVQKQLALFRKKAKENGIKLEEIDKIEKRAAPIKK